MAVDVLLGGPGSVADVLTIEDSSSVTTFATVNDSSLFGTHSRDGILLVDVLWA